MTETAVRAAAPISIRDVFDADLKGALVSLVPFVDRKSIDVDIEEVDLKGCRSVFDCLFELSTSFDTVVRTGRQSMEGIRIFGPGEVGHVMQQMAVHRMNETLTGPSLQQIVARGGLEQDSLVVKDGVEALSQYQCDNCDGDGTHTCGGCRGDGRRECTKCRYSTRPAGRVTCWYCNGTKGMVDQGTGKYCPCSICHGYGHIRCDECDATREVNCRDCAARGWVRCAPCAGSGWFTQLHSLKITARSSATLHQTELPDTWHNAVTRWFRRGPKSPGGAPVAELVPKWGFRNLKPEDIVQGDGGVRVAMRFTCTTMHGVARGKYEGRPFVGSCLYLQETEFAFTPFLDGALRGVVERSRKCRMERPSSYLAAISEGQPKLASRLRQSLGGQSGHGDFCRGIASDTHGAISQGAVLPIALDYQHSLDGFRRRAFWSGAGLAVAMLAAVWVLAWILGLFEIFSMFDWRTRPYAHLVFAGIMAFASKRLMTGMARYVVRRETHAQSRMTFGWKGWLFAVPLGMLLSQTAHWGMVFDVDRLW